MEAYIDEKEQSHYLDGIFGEDEQGILYKTKNESIYLWIEKKRENRYDYEDFKLMPLNGDSMLLPLYLLKSSPGYVFSIPKGFVPLRTIMNTTEKDKKAFYIKTGDIKRRLDILVNLSRIFMRLHSLPVMYGGISAERILISENVGSGEVCLLYSAAMSYVMDFREYDYTEDYIAPEMKSGKGGSVLSDYYTFAALAYNLLTLQGSFLDLPEEMQGLFDKALQQPNNQESRPKILDFHDMFMKYMDLIVVCKKCGRGIFFGDPNCKHCSSPIGKLLKATIYDQVSKTVMNQRVKVFEFATNRQYFYNYHTGNILLSDKHEVTLEFLLNISPDKKLHMILKNLTNGEITINGKLVPADQGHAVALPISMIKISRQMYSTTCRCIDIEIHA